MIPSGQFVGKSFPRILRNLSKGPLSCNNFVTRMVSNVSAKISQGSQEGKTKLATFRRLEGRPEVGVVRGDLIWSINAALPVERAPISSMLELIECWQEIKSRIVLKGEGTPLSNVSLMAPIPRPIGGVMCIGKNYKEHVKEVDTWVSAPGISQPDVPKHPIVFTKASQAVIGPFEDIIYPKDLSSSVDYEAELGVVIGKPGSRISENSAMDHVFGYTIINDVTARDLQKKHQQWFIGKSCDTFCPMGPWLVPRDEINGQDLSVRCWVDGELRQSARTSEMIFSIPKLISEISAAVTLQPGDVIATGTPAGVGSGFKPPRHLTVGQIVTIEIEGIGKIENKVVEL